jgi:O-antigen/teichoic acid export membrane protein
LVIWGFGVSTSIAVLVLGFYIFFFEKPYVNITELFIVLMITVGLGLHNLLLQLANSKNNLFLYAKLSWIKGVFSVLLSFLIISNGGGAFGGLLGYLIGLILSFLIFKPKVNHSTKFSSEDLKIYKEMILYGLPLTVNFIAIVIVDLVDRFMIDNILGVKYVAAYSVSYDFVQLSIGSIINCIYLPILPRIVNYFEKGYEESVYASLYSLGSKLLIIGLPASVAISVLSNDISILIFGSDYQKETRIIMPFLVYATFIGCFKVFYLDVAFLLLKKTKTQSYISLFMAFLNICLNLILLPEFGVVAAAWTTLITFLSGTLASWIYCKKLIILPNLNLIFFKSAIASGAMWIILNSLSKFDGFLWLLGKVILGFIVYVFMFWIIYKTFKLIKWGKLK